MKIFFNYRKSLIFIFISIFAISFLGEVNASPSSDGVPSDYKPIKRAKIHGSKSHKKSRVATKTHKKKNKKGKKKRSKSKLLAQKSHKARKKASRSQSISIVHKKKKHSKKVTSPKKMVAVASKKQEFTKAQEVPFYHSSAPRDPEKYPPFYSGQSSTTKIEKQPTIPAKSNKEVNPNPGNLKTEKPATESNPWVDSIELKK